MLHRWQHRAVFGALKNAIPFQEALRRAYRVVRPYRTNPENDRTLLGTALRQIDALSRSRFQLSGATIVELGTGWFPILPLVYLMAGAERIISVDQHRLLDAGSFRKALEYISLNLDELIATVGIDPSLMDVGKLPKPTGNLGALLPTAKIDYRAPSDFNDLPSRCADVIVSRTVLEHIAESELPRIFANARRILKPEGMMCHDIDMSDHFQHGDKSISRLNFMQYEPDAWRRLTKDPQFYQNRLRRSEFLALLDQAGFDIMSCTGEVDERAKADLSQMKVCKRYADTPPDEMAILTTRIVAKPRP